MGVQLTWTCGQEPPSEEPDTLTALEAPARQTRVPPVWHSRGKSQRAGHRKSPSETWDPGVIARTRRTGAHRLCGGISGRRRELGGEGRGQRSQLHGRHGWPSALWLHSQERDLRQGHAR